MHFERLAQHPPARALVDHRRPHGVAAAFLGEAPAQLDHGVDLVAAHDLLCRCGYRRLLFRRGFCGLCGLFLRKPGNGPAPGQNGR